MRNICIAHKVKKLYEKALTYQMAGAKIELHQRKRKCVTDSIRHELRK